MILENVLITVFLHTQYVISMCDFRYVLENDIFL